VGLREQNDTFFLLPGLQSLLLEVKHLEFHHNYAQVLQEHTMMSKHKLWFGKKTIWRAKFVVVCAVRLKKEG
jgi:hypothetical protein